MKRLLLLLTLFASASTWATLDNAGPEGQPMFFLTGNLLAEGKDSTDLFSDYIESARPFMLKSGVNFALLDVLYSTHDYFVSEGDVIAFTTAQAGGMKTLFADTGFQEVLPKLNNSLRGHWGYPLTSRAPAPSSFKKGSDYVLIGYPDGCAPHSVQPRGAKMIGDWRPVRAPKQPLALRTIELWEATGEKDLVVDRTKGECAVVSTLSLRDTVT